MKALTTLALLIIGAFYVQAQNTTVTPKVDERTELLSIVFRLAEADEYMGNYFPRYTKDIDSCFAPFKNHEVVTMAKTLRKTRGVSYDAIMSMAINIEITDSIRLNSKITEQSLDSRWGKKNANKFVGLLNKFYTETSFHTFFTNHSELQKIAEKNFTELLKEVDFTWFEQYYGVKTDGGYNLIISLANSDGNYGPSVEFKNGKKEMYAIIGTWETDSLGAPIYPKEITPTIIHEFNHSYCNPLVEANFDEMESMSDAIYKLVSNKMEEQAYGESKTMAYEILVRASVIKYFESKGADEQEIKHLIHTEKGRGFLWIEELVELLSTYEKNRDKYPSLQAFMPEIIKLQEGLSPKQLKDDYDSQCARIVSSSIANKSKNVNPNTKVLVVRFDRAMNIGHTGLGYGKRGKKHFPEIPKDMKATWNKETKMEWTIPIALKPNTKYSLAFPAEFFKSENFYSLKETYYLDFQTGDAE